MALYYYGMVLYQIWYYIISSMNVIEMFTSFDSSFSHHLHKLTVTDGILLKIGSYAKHA